MTAALYFQVAALSIFRCQAFFPWVLLTAAHGAPIRCNLATGLTSEWECLLPVRAVRRGDD